MNTYNLWMQHEWEKYNKFSFKKCHSSSHRRISIHYTAVILMTLHWASIKIQRTKLQNLKLIHYPKKKTKKKKRRIIFMTSYPNSSDKYNNLNTHYQSKKTLCSCLSSNNWCSSLNAGMCGTVLQFKLTICRLRMIWDIMQDTLGLDEPLNCISLC